MTAAEAMLVGAFCMHVYLRRLLNSPLSTKIAIGDCRIILVIDIGSSSIRCSPYMISNKSDGLISNGRNVKLSIISACAQKVPFKLSDIADTSQKSTESDACLRIMGIMGIAVDKCILSLRKSCSNFKAVHGIGISSLAMNIFGVNSENVPVSPLFT